MDYTVRKTIKADFPEILQLIQELHAESMNQYSIFCNDEVTLGIMDNVIETSLVMIHKDKIVGAIAGVVTTHIADNTAMMQGIMWHVNKKHRGYGLLLLNEFEEMCKQMKMKHLILSGIGTYKHEKFKKFCLSKGYDTLETHYIKNMEV